MAAEIEERIREPTGGKKRLRDSRRAMGRDQQSGWTFQIDELPATQCRKPAHQALNSALRYLPKQYNALRVLM